jgi:tetratricopeptide (TPR) repeat protein
MTRCSATVRGICFASLLLLLAGCIPPPGAGDESQAERFYSTGQAREKRQDFAGAVAAFNQALLADPQLAKAHYALARLYEQQLSSPEKALYHYVRTLELNPDFHGADLIAGRLAGVRMKLASGSVASIPSPTLAAEIDRLQRELDGLRAEHQRVLTENAGLRQALAQLQGRPVGPGSQELSVVPEQQPQRFSDNRTRTAQPPAQTPVIREGVVPPVTAARTHLIQKGDTLFSLQRRYGVPYAEIIAANPGISERNFPAGRTITIPAR